MVFYWFFAGIVLVLGGVSEFAKDKLLKHVVIFSIFFIMFIFSAFRVNIGIDYDGHYALYKVVNSFKSSTVFLEPIFCFVCILCRFIGIGFYGAIFIFSILTLYPIYYISKNEKTAIPLVFYYFLTYLISYALIRQMCGVSLSLLGTYIYNNQCKKKTGIFYLVAAGCVHSSLFFYLFIFLLGNLIKFNIKKTVIISLLTIFTINYIDLISLLGKILSNTKYGYYFLVADGNFSNTKVNSGIGVITRFVIYFIELYFLNTAKQKNNYKFNLCFIIMIICDLLSLRILIFLRLRYVFLGLSFYPFIYKNNFIRNRNNIYKLSTWLFLFICLFYILTFPATAEWGNIPYQSVFFTPLKEV